MCPTIQFNSDTNYPELASHPTSLMAQSHKTALTADATKSGVPTTAPPPFGFANFLAYFFSLNAYKILFAPGYLNAGCSVSFFLRYRRTFNIQVQISLYYADFLLLYLGIPFCSIYFILFY